MSNNFLKSIILFFIFLFCTPYIYAQSSHNSSSQQVQAGHYAAPKVRYVGPETLNVRSQPKTGKIVDRLSRGKELKVYDETNGWSLISSDKQRWVSSEHLCATPSCAGDSRWFRASAAKKTAPTRAASSSRSSSKSSYSSSGCSCSSSSNCYGPRGGRYCITSSGNKRYR